MTDEQWSSMSNVAYVGPVVKVSSGKVGARVGKNQAFLVQVDTAWALLRFFREGVDWGDQETKRRWAEEEYAAFLARERKPKLVPL